MVFKINNIKQTIFILFFYSTVTAQNYEFKEVSLRNFKGEFITVEKAGEIKISDYKILIFDQELEIKSKRIIFDEKGKKDGLLYSCSDSVNWYSVMIANDSNIYFLNKDVEMFRIKITLKPEAEKVIE